MLKKLVILIFLSLFLSGCSSKQPVEELTFSSWGSVTEVGIIKKIIADFESENPNIKVQFIHIPQNYFQKLHLLFASNTPPDVIFVNNLYLPLYKDYLLPLDGIINPEEFHPQSLEGMSYDGKLFAIPRDVSNLVFYVNKDLIELPPKWELNDLLKFHSKDKTWVTAIEEDVYWALPYLSYFGENITDCKKSLIFYQELRDKYNLAPAKAQIGSSTLAQMFLDEKIAIYLSGRWMYPKIFEKAEFNWEIVEFPQGKEPLPCDSSGWAIAKNSKHSDTAKKFIKYISSENSAEYFAKTGLVVPARIQASELLNNEKHNEKAFLDIIPKSTNTVVGKNYKKIMDKINSEFFN